MIIFIKGANNSVRARMCVCVCAVYTYTCIVNLFFHKTKDELFQMK